MPPPDVKGAGKRRAHAVQGPEAGTFAIYHAEEALCQSEARFAAFMRNLSGAAFLKDADVM
jgi:hypothetical protein